MLPTSVGRPGAIARYSRREKGPWRARSWVCSEFPNSSLFLLNAWDFGIAKERTEIAAAKYWFFRPPVACGYAN